MKVIVGCEYSGRTREAFRKLGHEAYSCDLLPADDNSYFHYQQDIFEVLDNHEFDLAIFHPPCTYLTNASVRWLYEDGKSCTAQQRWVNMREGANFFKKLLHVKVPLIAVENPIPHKYALDIIGRKYDQLVQPYMFGHPESKATCFWLKNLPKLKETNNVKAKFLSLPKAEAHKGCTG